MRKMDTASFLVSHSPEMHRGWWEMRVRYLCRELTSHTFIRNYDALKPLLDLWKRFFTYTTIQEESIFPTCNAIIERSRGVWKREVNEERWREGCDVMRENDTINVLSLFFFSTPDYYSCLYHDNPACRDLMDAFYPNIPYEDIEEAFRRRRWIWWWLLLLWFMEGIRRVCR